MSARNMRCTTLPLARSAARRTTAPARKAAAAVSSVELLSNTQTVASGRARAKSATTLAMVAASL